MYTTQINNCKDVAYVGISVQPSRGASRISYIGRVKNEEEGILKEGDPIQRVGKLAMNKWNQFSKKMLADLRTYLSENKPSSRKSKREVAEEREADKRQKRRSPAEIEAEREAKRRKTRQKEIEKAEKDVLAKAEEAKKALAALMHAEEVYRRVRYGDTPLGSQSTRPSPMSNYSNDPNENPINLDVGDVPPSLRFIYKGRAGEIPLPSVRKVVLVEELLAESNFESLPDGRDTEEDEKIRETRGYHVSHYGATQDHPMMGEQ